MARRAKVVELPLSPGALSDDTDLAAKLHAISLDKMRSRGARWETIKGWDQFNASGMSAGTARGVYTYADLHGNPIVIAASESAINAWVSGTRLTITPKWKDVWLGTGALAAGSTSTQLTVSWVIYTPSTDTTASAAAHDLQVGDSVTFSGVINTAASPEAVNTTYSVVSVTPTSFTITVSNNANITVALPFTCTVAFRTGLVTGTGSAVTQKPRIWSIDNFGENAVLCASDGTPVWYWQPETSGYSNLVTNGTFASSLTGWTAGSGWAQSGGTAVHTTTTSGALSQTVDGILEGGRTYEMSFDLVTFQSAINFFRIKIDAIDIFPRIEAAAGNAQALRTYTFRFVCPANPQALTITVDSSSGTNDDLAIDNVVVNLLPIAHPLNEAPQKNYALFVDGNHILSVLGSVESDGDFNPLLFRWCAQDNYREWITDTDNIAGELTLGKGSFAVCGGQVGDRNLILTDDGAYVATFTTQGYSVQLIAQGCGAAGNRAMAVHNTRAFWAGLKGFYVYDGAQVLPIECPVKDQYVGKLTQYQENKTFAWINTEYGEAWFHYPHTSDGNDITRYVTFNFLEQGNPWAFGTFMRTCFTRAGVFQSPISIDTSGNIWSHETGTAMTGGVTLPFIETGYVTAEAGDRWLGCRRYYPDIEQQTGNILFTITGKRAPQGQNNTQAIGPIIVPPRQRTVDFLLAARQIKFRWESEVSTTQWRLGVVGLEVVSERERR